MFVYANEHAPFFRKAPYLGDFPCLRAHENSAFASLHTAASPECISVVRSWSDPAKGVRKQAT